MAPPAFSDLGKQSRDIFSKGFQAGFFQLDFNTITENGIQFKNQLKFNQESAKVFGSTETKYNFKEYGVTLTEKVTTDNVVTADLTSQDKILKGLKITVDTSITPQTRSATGKLKTEYMNDVCKLNCDMDIDRARPLINAAGVFKYQQWLAGCQMHFNTQKCTITKNNFAIGYAAGDFALHANVNDGQVVDTSIYHKVSPDLDYGVNFNWTSGSNATQCGIGCKYALSPDTSLKAKINNALQVGLGFQQLLRDGVVLSLSAFIDAKNFEGGSHRLGVGLEFNL